MVKIFAHRGFSGRFPENTMLAFEEAVKLGVSGIELDVQLSKDGHPVILHDETLDRTTNGSGDVRDFTLAELRGLDARWKFGTDIPFQTIPTLSEYLAFIKETPLITNIELKTGVYEYPGIEEIVIDMVRKYGLVDRVYFSSFNHYSVLRAKSICPEAVCGILIDCWVVDAGKYAASLGLQTVNGGIGYFKKSIVREIHEAGLLTMAWTPNTRWQMRRLIDNGVDVLITNHPDLGLEVASGA